MGSRRRLFTACCAALTANAMASAICTDIMGDFVRRFRFARVEAGEAVAWGGVAGVAAMFIVGGLLDFIGIGVALWMACACHIAGVTLVIFAQGFWSLAVGWTFLAVASSLVEASTNPLVATMYPDKKTHMLNVFHAWWPGGLVIGGLLAWGLSAILKAAGASSQVVNVSWQIKMALVYAPVVLYVALILGQKFPKTERVQAGISTRAMFREALRPMFLILVFCMFLTASIELGPGRWVGLFIEDMMGIRGVLVLVYVSWLMFVLRFFAGPLAKRLSPIGIMAASCVPAGLGLLLMSFSRDWAAVLAASTVFAVGVTYWWPTMLGIVSERFPKGGTLLLALIGGAGGLFLSYVTVPGMGALHDHYAEKSLRRELPEALQGSILESYAKVKTVRKAIGPDLERRLQRLAEPMDDARAERERAAAKAEGREPQGTIPMSLLTMASTKEIRNQLSEEERLAVDAGVAKAEDPSQREPTKGLRFTKGIPEVLDQLDKPPLGEADQARARDEHKEADKAAASITFRYVAALSVVVLILFGAIFLYDKARGGYKQEVLATPGGGAAG